VASWPFIGLRLRDLGNHERRAEPRADRGG
jgi:hypothetical protein